MFRQRSMRPWLRAFEAVIVWVKSDKIDSKLAPGDDLIEKRFLVGFGCFGLLHSQSDGDRTDMTKMQVRGEAASVVHFRLVALRTVAVHLVLQEFPQCTESLHSSTSPLRNRGYGTIHLPAFSDINRRVERDDS